MSRAITFRQLEVLLAVARAGSFNAAARELDISQVSVSKHIAALERASGYAVFERATGRAAHLTEQGGELLNVACSMVPEQDRIRARNVTTHQRTLVQIAACDVMIERDFHPRLAEFYLAHPLIDVRFVPVQQALSTIPDLIERKVDLAYLALTEEPSYVSGRVVAKVEQGLYASPSLFERQTADPGGRPIPVIWPPDGGPTSRNFARSLEAAGLSKHDIIRSVPRNSTALELARLGVGVCCCSDREARRFCEAGELIRLGSLPTLSIYVILTGQRRDHSVSAAEEYFSNWLITASRLPH